MSTTEQQAKPQWLSFDDGDIVLRSEDGVEFRVDSVILRRASGLFADMLSLRPTSGGSSSSTASSLSTPSEPIQMTEAATTLDDLLRLIYPASPAPSIASDAQALSLLRAAERLQITSHALTRVLSSYLNTVSPPLRAWALSVRYNYPEARHDAVKRFVAEQREGDHLAPENNVPELASVCARSLLRLLRIKHDACEAAKNALTGHNADAFVWSCAHHIHMPWRVQHMQVIVASPFDERARSDAVLLPLVKAVGCANCMRRATHETTTVPRNIIRGMLAELLDSAARVEGAANADGMTTGEAMVGLAIPEIPPPPGPM
ncbi:hypothetical protein DL93DRAFT_2155878 [Clavulina sp. PMI_390]|nr:hypothetical protein DL93DRAFT_2155878 [Clavulina sp. PMI_390]